MQLTLLIVHFIVCLFLIVLVLIQQGKGADAGIVYGSGNASSVFGAGGSTSFLVKLTTVVAVMFFATTLLLGMRENQMSHQMFEAVEEDLLAEVVE